MDNATPSARERVNGTAKPDKPRRKLGKNHMDKPVDPGTVDPLHEKLEYDSKTATEDVPALTKSYSHEDVAVLSHSTKIRNSYQRTVESIVETGRLLIAAKDALGYGKFGQMFRYLPFGQRQAEMLMDIAAHPILSNSQYFANLPQSWATLHKLAGLTADQVKTRIEERHIHPAMTMRDAKLMGVQAAPPTPNGRRSHS